MRFELTEAATAAATAAASAVPGPVPRHRLASTAAPSGWCRARTSVQAWRHPEGGFEKCFCRNCGAHLFSRNPDDPRQMSVRLPAFDGDPGVRPSWRAHVASAAVWEPIPDDGLERYEGSMPDREF